MSYPKTNIASSILQNINLESNKPTMAETMFVIKRNGEREEVSFDKCLKRIQKLSKDLN